jgi:hypothetical protein
MANMSRIRDVMMAGDGVMDKTLIADEQQSSCIRQVRARARVLDTFVGRVCAGLSLSHLYARHG